MGQIDGNDLSHSGETQWTPGIKTQSRIGIFGTTYSILHFLKIFESKKNFFCQLSLN